MFAIGYGDDNFAEWHQEAGKIHRSFKGFSCNPPAKIYLELCGDVFVAASDGKTVSFWNFNDDDVIFIFNFFIFFFQICGTIQTKNLNQLKSSVDGTMIALLEQSNSQIRLFSTPAKKVSGSSKEEETEIRIPKQAKPDIPKFPFPKVKHVTKSTQNAAVSSISFLANIDGLVYATENDGRVNFKIINF